MKFRRLINAVDVFSVGMIHRVVIGGVPNIHGSTIRQKIQYLERNLDYIRKMVVEGPDDDKGLVAALITEPTNEEADVGLILMDAEGYPDMSGSLSFAVGTALVETGIIQPSEPVTKFALDSPVGLLKMQAEVRDGVVKSVTTEMTPAFFYRSYTMDLPSIGRIPMDISYGLNFFEPMINARELGIEVNLENAIRFEKIGLAIRDEVNKSVELKHPQNPAANRVKQVQFYDPEPAHPGVNRRSLVIVGPGAIDLTPSGTSTCAHMAFLHSKGELGINEEFVMESVVDAIIRGRIIKETKVSDYKAIVPEITGYTYIARFLTIVN